MQITEQTLVKLKNFSQINDSILIKAGSKIQTMHPQQLIVAETTVTEIFEKDFAVYELSKFIAAISLFKPEEREIEFSDRFCIIGKGKQKVKYWFCEPTMIVCAPYKTINFPDSICEIQIDSIDRLIKAAGVLQAPDCSFVGDGEEVKVVCENIKDETHHKYIEVLGTTDQTFKHSIKVENIRVMSFPYNVRVTNKGIIEFKNENVCYWLASTAV